MSETFAPKLTEREATVLADFGDDLRGSGEIDADRLACRGLLARGQKVETPLAGMLESEIYDELWHRALWHDYRLTRRGRLMLQRWQKDQDRRKWAEAAQP